MINITAGFLTVERIKVSEKQIHIPHHADFLGAVLIVGLIF